MKIIFTTLSLFVFLVCAFSQSKDTIHWTTQYKLNWEDFKGFPDTTVEHAAITSSGIDYSYHFTDSVFSFKVYAFFEKKKSWKKCYVNKYILKHEQLHFDITELYARKLKQRLHKFIANRNTLKTDITILVNKLIQEKENMQNLYDSDTDFSANPKKQVYWNNKIKIELQKLDDYKK